MADIPLSGQVLSLPPLHILVAEDTSFNRKYIRRLLDSWHCRATFVDNGRQAIQVLDGQHFDLLLMDVQMPEMDGLTATAMIRGQEKKTNRHLPIIAMAAQAMRGDRERCIDAGMDEYVSNPISTAALLEAIYRVVPIAGKERGSAAAVDADEMAALLGAFNNDGAFFKAVAGMFLSDYPPMLETLEKAIADEDGVLVSRTAHSLKGMARNFQVDAAADVARQVELLASQEQFSVAHQLFQTLADELAGFERRLKQMIARISED